MFDSASQTPPSQFDYDGGSVLPAAGDRAVANVQAYAFVAALPVSVIARCVAASSLRLWREQVTVIIATGVCSLSTLFSIGLAWIGVGALVFFT